MGVEIKTLFTLDGILKKGDRRWDGVGVFSVVDNGSPFTPMPFAGRWTKPRKNLFRSLGYSSADYAWQVLHAAIDQGLVPNKLEINLIMTCRSDEELKRFLALSDITIISSW
jgi:hypothetical protein